jgi:hypothetical protein
MKIQESKLWTPGFQVLIEWHASWHILCFENKHIDNA